MSADGGKGKGVCTAPGCDRALYVRGVCRGHYEKMRKAGDVNRAPDGIYTKRERTCEVPVRSKGWEPCGAPAGGRRPLCEEHREAVESLLRRSAS